MGIIDSIDLNPNHLATVKSILAEHVPECEVRAFGSRATWTAKDYSDLDLAVVGEGPLDWRTLGRLKEAFEESDLPMRVDVLDWHAISDSFRKVIEQGHMVVGLGDKEATGVNQWRDSDAWGLMDIEAWEPSRCASTSVKGQESSGRSFRDPTATSSWSLAGSRGDRLLEGCNWIRRQSQPKVSFGLDEGDSS